MDGRNQRAKHVKRGVGDDVQHVADDDIRLDKADWNVFAAFAGDFRHDEVIRLRLADLREEHGLLGVALHGLRGTPPAHFGDTGEALHDGGDVSVAVGGHVDEPEAVAHDVVDEVVRADVAEDERDEVGAARAPGCTTRTCASMAISIHRFRSRRLHPSKNRN